MIRLRHLLHPFRSTTSLYRLIATKREQALTERAISGMRRGRRDSCWCGGELDDFSLKPKYGICKECGCYVNRTPPLAEELNKLYSFGFYWHSLQKHRGHPVIEERTSNDQADGRVEYWLSLVQSCKPAGSRVLEIGCAHGVLLQELSRRGYICTGVEVDRKTAEWTRKKTGIEILSGVFPGVDAPECDLFLTFDVFEHSLSPEFFLKEAARLLAPGGIAIIQTPIEFRRLTPPFGEMHEKTFDDAQHLFVFSREGIRLLAERVGLELLAERDWRVGHEIVILKKEGPSPKEN